MLLTVSKRLEFSASRRLFLPSWSDAQNVAAFFRQDESALPRAFRKLRYSVMLWTFGLALMTALSAVSAWSKL